MKSLLISIILFAPFLIYAQNGIVEIEGSDTNPYFLDGIYLSYDDLNSHKVITGEMIENIKNGKYNSFGDLLRDEWKIAYLNGNGKRQEIKCTNVWGFCENGTLYIYKWDKFFKIPDNQRLIIVYYDGHSGFSVPIVKYTDVYLFPDSQPEILILLTIYDSDTKSVDYNSRYIMDVKTKEVKNLNQKSIKYFLSEDKDLFDKFSGLSSEDKKTNWIKYIIAFNIKHPICLYTND
jgi:hypothetical protein